MIIIKYSYICFVLLFLILNVVKLNISQSINDAKSQEQHDNLKNDPDDSNENDIDEISDINELPEDLKSTLLPSEPELEATATTQSPTSTPKSNIVLETSPKPELQAPSYSTPQTILTPETSSIAIENKIDEQLKNNVSPMEENVQAEVTTISTPTTTSSTMTPETTSTASITSAEQIQSKGEELKNELPMEQDDKKEEIVIVDDDESSILDDKVLQKFTTTESTSTASQSTTIATSQPSPTVIENQSTTTSIDNSTPLDQATLSTTTQTTSTQNEPVLKQPMPPQEASMPTFINEETNNNSTTEVPATTVKEEENTVLTTLATITTKSIHVDSTSKRISNKMKHMHHHHHHHHEEHHHTQETTTVTNDQNAEQQHQTVSPIPSSDLNETILNNNNNNNKPQEQTLTPENILTSTPSTAASIMMEKETNIDSNDKYKIVHNPYVQDANPTKFCTDLKPIKSLFNDHIEPIYAPILSILPENLQIFLLEETNYAGLSIASCLVLGSLLTLFMLGWFSLLKRKESKQINQTKSLNDHLLALNNKISTFKYEKETLEHVINDLEMRIAYYDNDFGDKDSKLVELNEKYHQLCEDNDQNVKDLEKARANETKITKELNAVKVELNFLKENSLHQSSDFETKMNELSNEYNSRLAEMQQHLDKTSMDLNEYARIYQEQTEKISLLQTSELELKQQLEIKDKTVQMLQNSLLKEKKVANGNSTVNGIDSSDMDYVNINEVDDILDEHNKSNSLNNIMKIAELQMEVKNLEDNLTEFKTNYDFKCKENNDLNEKLSEQISNIEKLQQKQKETEKLMKENEMQIKLLNELREKDTKQHLKVLTELDSQLKKKSTDADKASHFLDQIRVKQERIQELESHNARLEKQANQERQTYEKQVHENWLNSKKVEKELKETRAESTQLKDKINELEQLLKSHQQQQRMNPLMTQSLNNSYYLSPQQYQRKSNEPPSSPKNDEAQTSNSSLENNNSQENNNQLQVEVNNDINNTSNLIERPPSTASSQASSMNQFPLPGHIPYHNPFIRAPMRYPVPLVPPMMPFMPQSQQQVIQQDASSSSPSPDPVNQQPSRLPPPPFSAAAQMYRMHPMVYMQQQQLSLNQKLIKSGASSQQPSPAGLAFSNPANYNNSYFNGIILNLI
jgi:hypothetical protein